MFTARGSGKPFDTSGTVLLWQFYGEGGTRGSLSDTPEGTPYPIHLRLSSQAHTSFVQTPCEGVFACGFDCVGLFDRFDMSIFERPHRTFGARLDCEL